MIFISIILFVLVHVTCVGGNTNYKPCAGGLEAEKACEVDGIQLEDLNPGFSGAGYVNTTNAEDAHASWMLNSSGNDVYMLNFRFADGGGALSRDARLIVDGEQKETLVFVSTGSWSAWTNVSTVLELTQGVHELRLEAIAEGGLPNLDIIYFFEGIEAGHCLITGITDTCNKLYNVYPNPTNSKVQWSGSAEWSLLNALGVKKDQGYGNEIDLSSRESGIYLLKLGKVYHKDIKQ